MAILPFLLAASVASAPLPLAPAAPVHVQAQQSQPRPALWVVNDRDTIIYLFGTFHALSGKEDWFDRSVQTAFSASDQLILETLVPKPPVPLAIGRGNLAPVVRGQAPRPVAELAPSSFLGTTKMVMRAGRANGLSTDNGADAVLRDAADRIGKPVGELESFEYQLRLFSTLPPPPAAAAAQARDPAVSRALGAVLSQLQSAWSRGDIESFAPMLLRMQEQSPQIYETMFVQRNARWANWIAERMKKPGTVFVAVGAGHLSGPDSVQNRLAMLGVRSARVN